MTEDKFETYLLNKCQFVKDMLLIVKEEFARYCLETELQTVEDIIHHYNVIVKGITHEERDKGTHE